MASIINATTTAGVSVQGDNSGSLQLATNNGTTAVTIDTSQRVGVGTTSPQRKVSIVGTDGASGQTEGNSRTSLFLDNNGANYLTIMTSTSGDGGVFFSDNGSNNGGMVYETSSDALYFRANNAERMRIASDGTISTTIGSTLYGAYPARAWVNFNGTGTPAIRQSRNVSSITDNGTGDYTINFTQAMPDIEYSVAGAVNEGSTDNALPARIAQLRRSTPTTSSFRIGISNLSNTAFDAEYVFFQVFR